MPKGKKNCDSCGNLNGARAFACSKCGHRFAFNIKSKEQKHTKIIKDINWHDLQTGDKIKVSGGPYYIVSGEFIPMGYRGKFTVDSIDNNGIKAISEHGWFCHIYMGNDYLNKETKIFKTKHKISKLQKRQV